jgi:hypothetical protein
VNGQLDAIAANDRAWFDANPDRKYRVRLPLAGECLGGEPPAAFLFVLVEQLAQGLRRRVGFKCSPIPMPFSYIDPSGGEWEVTHDATCLKGDLQYRPGGYGYCVLSPPGRNEPATAGRAAQGL